MKTEIEIHRAHDILVAISLGEVPCVVSDKGAMHAALDALCWVLGHDDGQHGCNTAFGDNLRQVEDELGKRGFLLHRKNN